jgi:hypothetical protein
MAVTAARQNEPRRHAQLETMIFRSVKRTHDMFLADRAGPVLLEARSGSDASAQKSASKEEIHALVPLQPKASLPASRAAPGNALALPTRQDAWEGLALPTRPRVPKPKYHAPWKLMRVCFCLSFCLSLDHGRVFDPYCAGHQRTHGMGQVCRGGAWQSVVCDGIQ